jgi:hypothetical protein
MQFSEIQRCGGAPIRRPTGVVCVAPCPLHVLLATVLLGLAAWGECRIGLDNRSSHELPLLYGLNNVGQEDNVAGFQANPVLEQ